MAESRRRIERSIAKFMGEATEAIIKATDAKPGDLLMFGADKSEIVAAALGAIRTRLGKIRTN